MHDIWNPWHGCAKASEGCDHCYMFTMDRRRGLDPTAVRRSRTGFDYPLQRTRDGSFRVRSGELIRVCMNSDFFLPEADAWRPEAWNIMRERSDVRFFLLTKRPERIAACLPPDWGDGWPNVMLNVSCEDQRRADERIPLLLGTPAAHRGIMCAPLIGSVTLRPEWLMGAGGAGDAGGGADGVDAHLEQVICGGENYEGARPCHWEWIEALSAQCRAADVSFTFIETGSTFVKDGRAYHLRDKTLQSVMAWKSGASHPGRPIEWELADPLGLPVPPEALWQPRFRRHCATCGSRPVCNGCSECGRCGRP